MKKILAGVLIAGCLSLFVVAQKFGGFGGPGGPGGHSGSEEEPPEMPGEPPEGFGSVPDEEKPELTAEKVLSQDAVLSNENLTASKEDQSVLLVHHGAEVSVSDSTFNKKGGNSSNDGQSNFYGLNAALVVTEGNLTLSNVEVYSDADGSNAVFATGKKSNIQIDGIKIYTKQNSSRGLDSTYGGTISAKNVDITTEGAHCAAFATDRGEGNVSADGGKALTSGEGSPVIYSTGNIQVSNLQGVATGSEIAVIEGKNSISIKNSNITGGTKTGHGNTGSAVMLYQSMSGDAGQGTSVFTVEDSTLTSTSDGAFFYVTNTSAKANLKNTKLVNQTGKLIQVSQNNSERGWGRKGANGGSLEFTAENQVLEGSIEVDEISSASLYFNAGTVFTGSINSEKQGKVNLYLDKSALLTLTDDAYVNVLSLEDKKGSNIVSNGHTIYYNKNAAENKKLKGKTIKLKDGGQLVGIEMEFAEPKTFGGKFDSRQKPPAPPKAR
ncbi:MAG: hypothetical protein IJ688_01715 [Treponema sp.]|nr:hypothetical protein [Treponema sp.]